MIGYWGGGWVAMDQGTGETAIMTAVSFHAREVDGKTGSVLLLLMSSQLLTAWQQLPQAYKRSGALGSANVN